MRNPVASSSQLQQTPSREAGVSPELERDLRAYGAILIQQTAILVQLPQIVQATACILFQRFWFVTSLTQFGIRDMVVACLFLAAKLEEVDPPVRLRDLINSLDYLVKLVEHERPKKVDVKGKGKAKMEDDPSGSTSSFRYVPQAYFAKEFYEMKEEAVIGEMQLLKRLGFNLTVQHAYGALANYLQVLQLTDVEDVAQRAWNVCNDALLTPLLAMYPPTHVAVASIFLATAKIDIPLPMQPQPWYTLFGVADEDELCAICLPIMELYEEWGDSVAMLSLDVLSMSTLWRTAAQKNLPLTKAAVREIVGIGGEVQS